MKPYYHFCVSTHVSHKKFMKKVMPEVGEAIRASYNWVPDEITIFLYLDNAGGHGTKEVVEAYVNNLAEVFNVICVHQRPRSPATNMLDLGVWMAFQSVVEKKHYRHRKDPDALGRTVDEAWDALEDVKLQNVYGRWLKVLDLIIEGDGGNDLIEARRGKLFSVPSEEAEVLDEVEAEEDGSADGELSPEAMEALEHSDISDE